MGSIVARDVFGIANPRVGLLNIGEEDTKGHELIQEAHELIRASGVNYLGFVEGNNIFDEKRRRGGHRRLHRQRRAEGDGRPRQAHRRAAAHGILAQHDEQALRVASPPGTAARGRQARSAALQRRLHGRTDRSRGKKPRQRGPRRIRPGHQHGRHRDAPRTAGGHCHALANAVANDSNGSTKGQHVFTHRRHGFLPAGKDRHEFRSREEDGYHRRVDPLAHRHRTPAHRRRRPNYRRPGRNRRAPRHRGRGRHAGRNRFHRVRHHHARSRVPQLRHAAAGAPRCARLSGVLGRDRLQRLHLRAVHRRQVRQGGRGQVRAGGRRRNALAHHQLGGSQHRGVVRRRRRRRGAQAFGRARHHEHAPAFRRRLQGSAVRRERRLEGLQHRSGDQQGRHRHQDGRQRSVQGRGHQAGRRGRRSARGATAWRNPR